VTGDNNWASRGKGVHLLTTLEERANILATYEALENHYEDHHLAAEHHSRLKARTQLSESLQEFATAIK
jgi:hypothetical protein